MAWVELEDHEPNQGTPGIQKMDATAVSYSEAFTHLSEDNEDTRYRGQKPFNQLKSSLTRQTCRGVESAMPCNG
ncbi:MAG: hypothetical protein CMP95_02910 [Gammaproteobacteria bacterium]|nr:hypothetical protein [Gammaproteobacteria bacterium]